MERISSARTFLFKWVLPLLNAALFVAGTLFAVAAGALRVQPLLLLVPLVVMIGTFVFLRFALRLADEVRDGGAYLLVRRGGIEERVQLACVMNVNVQRWTSPPLMTLRLREAGRFGDEISFIPRRTFSFNPFARDRLAESLITRIDRLRQQA